MKVLGIVAGIIFGTVLALTACTTSTATVAPAQPTSTSVPPTQTAPPPTISPTPTITVTPEVIELNPSPRAYVSMAYDSESKQIILFGGQTGDFTQSTSYNGETWAYDVITNTWNKMKPDLSPARASAGVLVYDSESDRIIYFGGTRVTGKTSSVTWVYDFNSNTWTKMRSDGPTNHLGLKMAYDAESDRVILFGGYDISNDQLLNDTWAYDFNSDTWTEMQPKNSPPGRNFHAMTYDSKIDRVVMWGGDSGGVDDYSNVWLYDYNTNTWKKRSSSNGPTANYYSTIAYDSLSDQILLFGYGSAGSNETWAYDYNANIWTRLEEQAVDPFKLSRHAFVYVPDVDRFVLFGGHLEDSSSYEYSQATWIYDLTANEWTETTRYP